MPDSWERRVSGADCPLDAPRPDCDTERYLVRRLRISSLYLDRNQAYHGHCILIFDARHVTRIDALSADEWQLFANDLRDSCGALVTALHPDHLNVESLGNMVPHLHWHLFPRFRTDPRWGLAVWTTNPADMPVTLTDEKSCMKLATTINAGFPATA